MSEPKTIDWCVACAWWISGTAVLISLLLSVAIADYGVVCDSVSDPCALWGPDDPIYQGYCCAFTVEGIVTSHFGELGTAMNRIPSEGQCGDLKEVELVWNEELQDWIKQCGDYVSMASCGGTISTPTCDPPVYAFGRDMFTRRWWLA